MLYLNGIIHAATRYVNNMINSLRLKAKRAACMGDFIALCSIVHKLDGIWWEKDKAHLFYKELEKDFVDYYNKRAK